MSMFDYVNYKAKCEKCGADLTDFQTKDNVCEMVTLEPYEVDSFYTSCNECRTWHNFKVDRVCILRKIDVTTASR